MNEMTTSMIAINKWMFFTYNYPYNFINQVWADEEWLIDHLKGKFDYYYDKYGAYGVIPVFYAELDGNNKKKLMRWVMENFTSEQKLSFNEED